MARTPDDVARDHNVDPDAIRRLASAGAPACALGDVGLAGDAGVSALTAWPVVAAVHAARGCCR